MSGASKSRSKSVIKTKSKTEQQQNEVEEKKDEQEDVEESTALIEALTRTNTPIIRRYKQPYRNFLRDVKIQLQKENLSNKDIARIASQRWKTMTQEEKEPYVQEAAYAKELDSQNQKQSNCKPTARQQAVKRKRKCPKCGGYPPSSSPSEQSTTTEPATPAATSEEESAEESKDYTTDSSKYSYPASEPKTVETGNTEHDAPKKSKKRSKRARKSVKRRRKHESPPTSGSASYYGHSSDNTTNSVSVTSDYTSASI